MKRPLNYPPVILLTKGTFSVKLSCVGNPDYRQDPARPLPGVPTARAHVQTLAEARDLCRHYITYFDLGGGNWPGGEVIREADGLVIGYFSYNGRLWDKWGTSGAKEIPIPEL